MCVLVIVFVHVYSCVSVPVYVCPSLYLRINLPVSMSPLWEFVSAVSPCACLSINGENFHWPVYVLWVSVSLSLSS